MTMAKEHPGKSARKVTLAKLAGSSIATLAMLGSVSLQAAESNPPLSPLEPQSVPDARGMTGNSGPELLWTNPGSLAPDGGNEIQLSIRDSLQLNVELSDDNDPSQTTNYAGTTGIWSPGKGVSLKAGIGMGQQNQSAQSAGFGCLAGTSGYLDCITNRAAGESSVQTYTVGASWQATQRLQLSVDYFNQLQEATVDQAVSAMGRTQGLDVTLSCDIDAGHLGGLEFGLQFSRIVQDGELLQSATANPLTDPYDQAVLGLGWNRGNFRTDLTSRHMEWLGDDGLRPDPWTTVDISFAWRTPWNASLSVGARNVLNNPAPNSTSINDAQFQDMLGRVPYVRYKQDL
jgi:hypothetical protein